MVALAAPLLILLAASCPGSAYRTVSQLDLADGVLQKAKGLLLQYPKLSLTDEEVAETLGKHPDLHNDVVSHEDGQKVSSALLERARSALSGSEKLDDAAHRKETPCHCVLEKVEDVDMDHDLEVGAIGTYLNLDMDNFPVTADKGPVNVKMVDLDDEKDFWSDYACNEGCFSYCKDDSKFIIDDGELRELGITQSMGTVVAAQCKGSKCECLDMDRTKKYIRALKTVQKGDTIDVASEQIHNFPSEGDCLSSCGGICEEIESWLEENGGPAWDKQGDKEMDWEGVCFDEA